MELLRSTDGRHGPDADGRGQIVVLPGAGHDA